jgi:C-terminal processing protease CtpA/Prc
MVLATIAVADEAKGWFGFAAIVDVDATSSPSVKSIRIDSVVAGSPAEKQKLAAGDEIIEAEGLLVADCKAQDLQVRMNKHVGETLHLKLKRAGGETYSANLVAAAKPKQYQLKPAT